MSNPARSGNLKPAEIRPLVLAAKAAYDHHAQFGLVDPDGTFDSWRREQCLAAVGKSGLTACTHGDFQPLMAHFKTLSGDLAGALSSHLKTGAPVSGADPGDTWETRRLLAHQIATAVTRHTAAAGKIGVGYVVSLVRAKTRRPDLTLGSDWEAGLADRCTTSQLVQIRDTVINRISAADGVGCPANRNKSQRQQKLDQKFSDFGRTWI
jgi:hypothetical protein